MDSFIRKKTKNSPEVVLNPEAYLFYFKGESRPENATFFFDPIVNWLDAFEKSLINSSNTNEIVVDFYLSYFNSASFKYYGLIIRKFCAIHLAGYPTKINWHFEEDDEEISDAGLDLQELISGRVPFLMIREPIN